MFADMLRPIIDAGHHDTGKNPTLEEATGSQQRTTKYQIVASVNDTGEEPNHGISVSF
jgi:hypothetical protein